MKKIHFFLCLLLFVGIFSRPVQAMDIPFPADQPDGKPDPGLPWSGRWQVVWVDDDQYSFKLKWIDAPPNVFCDLVILGYCLDGPGVNPPKKGDIYIREGNQKWRPDPQYKKNTQWIGYSSTEIYQCGAFVSNVSRPGCCDECEMCYEVGHMENGKWIKEQDLGCAPFAEDSQPIPYLPGKPVRLFAPQELKASRVCSISQPDINTAYIERLVKENMLAFNPVTGENWVYHKDLIARFADNSGRINCADLDYSTDQFRAHFAYYEQCPCWSGVQLTDPGEIIIPDGAGH